MTKMPHVSEEVRRSLLKADDKLEEMKVHNASLAEEMMEARSVLPEVEEDRGFQYSKKEVAVQEVPVIRPRKSVSHPAPFNEKFRKQWNRGWQYVTAIVDNHELIGQDVECWTKQFPGDPAHFWIIPCNRPVKIPRLLVEQLNKCCYSRMTMEAQPTQQKDGAVFYGAMKRESLRHRISARIIDDSSTSIAMGF